MAARVGIHSGAVVVGTGAAGRSDAFGDAPNIAARVQAAAEPATALITENTHRLVSGRFDVEERGAHILKGIEHPFRLYKVLQPSGARGRLGTERSLTPFIGRAEELRVLLSRWEQVRRHEGQVVIISGEPGIGKSRLLRQFREQITGEHQLWIESAADEFAQSTPFYAVAQMLRQGIGLRGDEDAEGLIEHLHRSLEAAGVKAKDALPLIAQLVNVAVPGNYPALPAAPEERRRRLLASLAQWAIGLAKIQPMVIVLEDLQWADASTLELARLLADQGVSAPLMLIYTARIGFALPWPMKGHYAQLTLDRLSDIQAGQMVAGVANEKELSSKMAEAAVQRASGVPLFVEELIRDLLERGDDSASGQIPATLHDLLMARLDRLGRARELAQIGAVIGREFSHELIRTVASISEDELKTALEPLINADLLHVHREDPDKCYIFKHALVRDAAYGTLLKTRRRELHQRIAGILEEQFPENLASAPELLAHHFTEAGLAAQAVRYWRRAGRRATEQSANLEAIAHLNKALELLKTLPPASEHLMEEVKLQMALTTPLIAIKGYTAREVETACNRALELCQEAGDVPELFAVLGGLASIYFNRCDLEIALELDKRMLRLAEARRDPILILWANYALGFTVASMGKWKSARDHLERSIALYDPRRAGTYGFVQDPGPTAMALLSHVVHALGYPDQALVRIRKALTLARDLSHPFTMVWVLGHAGHLYWLQGEKTAARELWEEGSKLCAQHGFRASLAGTASGFGFALVEQGRSEDGLARIRDALQSMVNRSYTLALLGLAEGKGGQADHGLATINEALALSEKNKQFGFLSGFYLFKGELLLMKNAGGLRKPKQSFSSALQIAREQNAKSDELRATIPLVKLMMQQGRREQARAMLSKIYNWFTEGFDTADLKEGKALLDELQS